MFDYMDFVNGLVLQARDFRDGTLMDESRRFAQHVAPAINDLEFIGCAHRIIAAEQRTSETTDTLATTVHDITVRAHRKFREDRQNGMCRVLDALASMEETIAAGPTTI
jgi:hypothetical protein